MSFTITTLIMFGFWMLLSGYFDFFHIATGLFSSALVALASRDLLLGREIDALQGLRRFLRFLGYVPWLMVEIFKANLDVAWRTLHPEMPIDPVIFYVKTDLKTDLGKVTFANSITLTPGTVTVAASLDGEFMVHAIAAGPADSLQAGEMARRVERIEGGHV